MLSMTLPVQRIKKNEIHTLFISINISTFTLTNTYKQHISYLCLQHVGKLTIVNMCDCKAAINKRCRLRCVGGMLLEQKRSKFTVTLSLL